MNTIVVKKKSGGTSAQWYYSNVTDSYNDFAAEGGDYAIGADVYIGQTGNVTKLSVKISATDSDNVKLAIFDTSGNRLHAGGEITADLAVGWNDLTLGSPYAVTVGTTLRILFCAAGSVGEYHNNSGTGYWLSANYSSFPDAAYTLNSESGKLHAVRVYVE